MPGNNPESRLKSGLGGGQGAGVVGQIAAGPVNPTAAQLGGPQGPGLLKMPPEPPEEFLPGDDVPLEPPAPEPPADRS